MAEWDTEEQSQLDTCTLYSIELPGGGSAWHVMSSCSHTGLEAQRERMAGPFETVARWVRAEWSQSQWWVEQKKEDATRNRSKGAGFRRNRRGLGNLVTPELPRGRERPRGGKDYI